MRIAYGLVVDKDGRFLSIAYLLCLCIWDKMSPTQSGLSDFGMIVVVCRDIATVVRVQ